MNLHSILKEECHVDPAVPILVGVSGGPDSLCLLDVLHHTEYNIIVAHFDHCLRPDSAQDAAHVKKVAESLSVPFILGREDVKSLAEKESLSLEEAARKARYRFLFDAARRVCAQAVAVAHSADDQVETVLMHLLRGSGLSGLRGMAYHSLATEWGSNIPLIRPLLGVWRLEIQAYCEEHGLQPHFDPTNQDTAFYRNRLRHHLIPTLEEYNPQARQVIWRMARTLAADAEVLEEYIQPLWDSVVLDQGTGYICLSRTAFQIMRVAQKRSVLRRAIAYLRPALRDIDFDSIQRAADFIDHPTATRKVDLISNLRLFLDGDRVFLAEWNEPVIDRAWPQLAPDDNYLLTVPGELALLNGFRLVTDLQDIPAPADFVPPSTDPFHAWLDADRVTLPLTVRSRRPGDRYCPLGMGVHSVKLSDFFINHALPARARPAWPLVCTGSAIAWVPGFQPAEFCRITADTRHMVHLELINLSRYLSLGPHPLVPSP